MNTKYFIISCTLLMQAFLSPTELVASLVPLTTSITKPTCVAFLQGDKIVIGSKNQLEMIDLATNTTLLSAQYCDDNKNISSDLAIHRDKTDFAFPCNGIIRRYNGKTGAIEFEYDTQQKEFIPICFNSQEKNMQIVAAHITFSTDLQESTELLLFNTTATLLGEPITQMISCNSNPTDPSSLIFVMKDNNDSYASHEYQKEHGAQNILQSFGLKLDAYCNHDATVFITNYVHSIWLTGKYLGDGFCYRIQDDYYSAMELYSNNIIALLTQNNSVDYWDFIANKCLVKITCLQSLDIVTTSTVRERRLSFSPDKNKLLVALQNKCFIIPVPFCVKYMPETMQELFLYFSFLVHISHTHDNKGQPHEIYMPKEVVMEIIEKMLPFYERP